MIAIETITGSKYIGTHEESFIFEERMFFKLYIDKSSHVIIPEDKVVAYKVVN
jgi:hypothetical protein